MGYSDTIPRATNVANFERALGRCELHLSGMRGAPPKASLAADYVGNQRPQSAMAILRSGGDGLPKQRLAAVDNGRPIPEGMSSVCVARCSHRHRCCSPAAIINLPVPPVACAHAPRAPSGRPEETHRGPLFPEAALARSVDQQAHPLSHAHRQAVVHRSNILDSFERVHEFSAVAVRALRAAAP